MKKIRRGVREEQLRGVLFLKIVFNEVACGDHCRPGEKQLHWRCHWFDVISNERSERICGHYHENSGDKDRNFSQPIHTQVTP
jgi:hypothetical protein